MAELVVIGGGIAGLGTALLAARRGHTVALFEREARAPGSGRAGLDEDFFDWRRPGVPQAAQPHALLGAARAVLRGELPDVYETLLRLGARERHELDWFGERPPARPGDEHLVLTQTRRIVLESALTSALCAEPGAELRYGEPVTGLITAPTSRPPRVTGVRTAAGSYTADLVVDAAGRLGGTEVRLAAAGCRPGVTECHRTGLAYFCRWYRLPGGRLDGPMRPWTVNGGTFAGCAVFPSDNGVFAVTLFVHTDDPTRAALRDPDVFEAAAAMFPPGAAWLALGAEPLSDVLPAAGLDNRWSASADEAGQPVVAGLIGVGDTLTHTNPTLAQGMSLALWAARWVADHAEDQPGSPGFAAAYHAWAKRTLKPWFDVQVTADREIGERLATRRRAVGTRETGALFDCALDDPEVMRARARVRHLMASPAEAYGAPEIRRRVAAWLAARPGYEPNAGGPSRAAWERITGI
ncbi:FAD-dependent oxidoreductase [Streptomyces sannanensis]|uniref:FAD-dependent oxidoreductase n=1 Tax=Streptomyces sannanensis TaxID=285536 RepID=A0ABP6SKM4_9ACTN